MIAEISNKPFAGLYTALVTPFDDHGIAWDVLDALVDRQIEAGVDGLVPCGSTGESATLDDDEQAKLIEAVVIRAAGRCKVLAGTGSNSTEHTIRRTVRAAEFGVDGVMLVTPYYNRPSQEGLFQHFAAVAERIEIPLMLYNVPTRCAVDLLNETVLRLHESCEHIVAIKDASGGTDRVAELAGGGIDVLCGDDGRTLASIALGAVGVVSVISNLVPHAMAELVKTATAGAFDRARTLHLKIGALCDRMAALGPNPVPIKSGMAAVGLLKERFRLPLCPPDEYNRNQWNELLRRLELR